MQRGNLILNETISYNSRNLSIQKLHMAHTKVQYLNAFLYNFQRSDTILRRSLDAFLSFFVEFNVILAWHGLWTILDIWQAEQKHSNEYTG